MALGHPDGRTLSPGKESRNRVLSGLGAGDKGVLSPHPRTASAPRPLGHPIPGVAGAAHTFAVSM